MHRMTPSPSVPHLTSITPHDTHAHARNTVSVRSLTYAAEANELINDTTSLYIDQHSLNVLSCAALWREMMLEYLREAYSRGTTASFYDPVVSSFYWFSPLDLADDAGDSAADSADGAADNTANTAIVCDAVTVRAAVFHRATPQTTVGAARHEFDSDYLAAADADMLDDQCAVWFEARIDAAWMETTLAHIAERNAAHLSAARTAAQKHIGVRRQARMAKRNAVDLCEVPHGARSMLLRQKRKEQPDAQLPPKDAPIYTVHHLPDKYVAAQPTAGSTPQHSHARQQHPVPRVPGAWNAEVRRLVDLGADIDTAWVCQAGTSTSAQPTCLPLRDCS